MKRAKESLPDELAFAPVRLLGGFLCADLHLGCRGCSFCLNRRDPRLARLLDAGLHLDLTELGIGPGRILSLLHASRAFTEARIPLRIGHLTDWQYEAAEAARLCRMLSGDYPCVLLTRFPLSPEQRSLVASSRALLAHVTLTPAAPGLEAGSVPAEEVIASTAALPREALVYMIRPLAAGAEEEAKRLFSLLPPESFVALRRLSTERIPTIGLARAMAAESIDSLARHAREKGHRVLAFFGCALHRRLGLPFFRHRTAEAASPESCRACPLRSACEEAQWRKRPEEDFVATARSIGLDVQEVRQEEAGGCVWLETATPATRGDEIFLSELFGQEILLSTVARAPRSGVTPLPEAVLVRWEETGVLPTRCLRGWSRRAEEAVARRIGQ